MHEIPDSFEFRGLLCFPRPSTKPAYYFLPLHPDLDRDAGGRPQYSLIAAGAAGFLMLTAALRAPDENLEALRAELARRDQISDPRTIELTYAPIRVSRCDLLLGDGADQFQVLASSSTSGMPPYSALFNVSLTEKQFAAVAAAVNGRSGFLAIEYDTSLALPVTATARLVPLSDGLVPWLRRYASESQAGFRDAIEQAIEDGLAAIETALPDQPSGKLVGDLYDRVLDRAAELLPRLIESWGDVTPTDLQVAVTLSEQVSRPFRPRTDLSSAGLDPKAITYAGTGSPAVELAEAMAPTLRVKLGFDPADAPLAWIRLQRGNSEVVLRPPRFTPGQLPAAAESRPLRVTVAYTNGSPTYKTEMPSPGGELLLMPDDLGLTRLAVDARPLAQAGARSAQISLHFRPPRPYTEQRHSIQFGNGNWVAHRWLATRPQASLRYLGYRWTATTADGRAVSASTAQTDSSNIILSFIEGATDAANRSHSAN